MTISKSLYKQLRLLFQPIIREVGDGKILLPPKELYGELRAMDKDEYLQILVSQINEFIGNEGVYPTFEQVNEMLADYRTADEQDVIDNTKADNSRFPVQSPWPPDPPELDTILQF